MKIRSQKGFAALETLLILVIVAIIGGTGWYVLSSKNDIYQNYDSASSSSNSQPTKKAKDIVPTQKKLTIKEWGVKASYSGNLDLNYKITSDGKLAAIGSKQLSNADPQCTKGGSITRLMPSDLADAAGDTAQQLASKLTASDYAHIDNFYYFFLHDQAGCSDKDAATALQFQNNDMVKSLVPKLQKVSE